MKIKYIILILIIFLIPTSVHASVDSAYSYTLMDMKTGRILMAKNENSPKLIASITKIMTCIIAIEKTNLDDVVEVDDTILKAHGSGIYIEVGEHISVRDLLYGLMLRSGNDAAIMIAKYVAGDVSDFVDLMNAKAKELGMKNTIFHNPSGLDDDEEGNLSTTYDMALLTSYAMKNEDYQKIVKTKKHIVKTDRKTYSWTNKNKLLQYDYITGGKTGYTENAKRTLVSTAHIDNMDLVVVTIRDSDDWNTHTSLYEYAKDNYYTYKVLNKDTYEVLGEEFYQGNNNNRLYIKNDTYVTLNEKETGNLINRIKLVKLDKFKDGDEVGENQIYLNNKLLTTEKIYVAKSFNKNTSKQSFWDKLIARFKS